MPKKMGVNSKSEVAKSRKNAAEAEQKDGQSREKDEQYWREAEGPKSKSAKKREEEAEKKAESSAKKAEARRLAEQEEKELEKALKKLDKKKANQKVTEAELVRRREEEQAGVAKRKQARMTGEEEYEKMVLVSNTNRDDSLIDARTVDEAIARMSTVAADNVRVVDRHPEKRLKASFKAYEEAEMPRLKEEKPGLTHTQYKELIGKMWKKSPDNPLNQVNS